MDELGPIEAVRLTGDEPFRDGTESLSLDVLDYWRWSASDLVSNTQRGVLAEFLVASAIGIAAGGVREEWAAFDLEGPDGTRIKVKSASYIQRWHQTALSKVAFRCPKTKAWDSATGQSSAESRRQADVYVFALEAHTDQATLDLLDVSQWVFFVVPTYVLDERTRSQQSITLPSLTALAGESVVYSALAQAIASAAGLQKSHS